MNITSKRINLIAILAIVALGLTLPAFPQAKAAQAAPAAQAAAAGEKVKVEGVILKHEGDTLTLRPKRRRHNCRPHKYYPRKGESKRLPARLQNR
jgi:hypothetical protein